MKKSINSIKFLTFLFVVFLMLTYITSVNFENSWIVLNSLWISNNFVFAIAGGSLASLLVVLAGEIQKYQSIKRQVEDYIFSQLFSLYDNVIIIHYNIKRQLNDVSSPVPSNLIDELANRGKMCLANLTTIDYFTFCKHNTIKEQLIQYRGNSGTRIQFFLQDTVFFKMAINEDKLTLLKQRIDVPITSNMPNTHQTLKKIINDSSVVLSFIEKSLDIIDKECKNRYHWSELKRNIIFGEENFVSVDIDKYLGQPLIQFEDKEI